MSKDENDSINEMYAEFISEIKEDLQNLETYLLVMEEKGKDVDQDLINHAFRSIHSIKGGAGFISFEELAELSHAMENVLMRVREGSLVINSGIVDSLLSGFDKMNHMINSVDSKNEIEFIKEKKNLENIILAREQEKAINAQNRENGDADDESYQQSAEDETERKFTKIIPAEKNSFLNGIQLNVERNHLKQALLNKKFVYGVSLDPEHDLSKKNRDLAQVIEDIENTGELLYSDFDKIQGKDVIVCIVSTILDKSFLSKVLEIKENKIISFKESGSPVSQKKQNNKDTADKKSKQKTKESKKISKVKQSDILEREARKTEKIEHTSYDKSTSFTPETVRINVELISKLMNQASELVLTRNQIKPFVEKNIEEISPLVNMIKSLDMVTTQIQEAVMRMRMQPVSDLLGKYKRVVRDISKKLSKEVEYSYKAGDVELDRNVLENLVNPFIHLIRNCIDHGIETTQERIKAGKPPTGKISIEAFHQGGHVHIILSDDGAGIDPEQVAQKAFIMGLVSQAELETMTDSQKINLIFWPGFSTSDTITDISGRGVGMDVVKTNIEMLRGFIDIESKYKKGTSIQLIIPLTLAIIPSLIVGCGQSRFAINQLNVKEVLFIEPGEIHSRVENLGSAEVFRLRESFIPVVRLRNILGITTYVKDNHTGEPIPERRMRIADRRRTGAIKEKQPDFRSKTSDRRESKWDSTYIVILKSGHNIFGLCVDELFDIEEIVVNPLSDHIKECKCFSGATILGDGSVIMILDVAGVASIGNLHFEAIKKEEQNRKDFLGILDKTDELKEYIVIASAKNEFFGIELKLLSRLESILVEELHKSGELKCIERDTVLCPVFYLSEFIPVNECEMNQGQLFVILLKNTASNAGIIASEIVDTIKTYEHLQKSGTLADGVKGKLFLDEMMVQVLDIKRLINLIDERVAPKS